MLPSELIDRCGRIDMEHVVDFLSSYLFRHAFFHCRCVLELVNVIHNQQCLDAGIQDPLVTRAPLVHVVVSDVFDLNGSPWK